jgi:hypothetical protein
VSIRNNAYGKSGMKQLLAFCNIVVLTCRFFLELLKKVMKGIPVACSGQYVEGNASNEERVLYNGK